MQSSTHTSTSSDSSLYKSLCEAAESRILDPSEKKFVYYDKKEKTWVTKTDQKTSWKKVLEAINGIGDTQLKQEAVIAAALLEKKFSGKMKDKLYEARTWNHGYKQIVSFVIRTLKMPELESGDERNISELEKKILNNKMKPEADKLEQEMISFLKSENYESTKKTEMAEKMTSFLSKYSQKVSQTNEIITKISHFKDFLDNEINNFAALNQTDDFEKDGYMIPALRSYIGSQQSDFDKELKRFVDNKCNRFCDLEKSELSKRKDEFAKFIEDLKKDEAAHLPGPEKDVIQLTHDCQILMKRMELANTGDYFCYLDSEHAEKERNWYRDLLNSCCVDSKERINESFRLWESIDFTDPKKFNEIEKALAQLKPIMEFIRNNTTEGIIKIREELTLADYEYFRDFFNKVIEFQEKLSGLRDSCQNVTGKNTRRYRRNILQMILQMRFYLPIRKQDKMVMNFDMSTLDGHMSIIFDLEGHSKELIRALAAIIVKEINQFKDAIKRENLEKIEHFSACLENEIIEAVITLKTTKDVNKNNKEKYVSAAKLLVNFWKTQQKLHPNVTSKLPEIFQKANNIVKIHDEEEKERRAKL